MIQNSCRKHKCNLTRLANAFTHIRTNRTTHSMTQSQCPIFLFFFKFINFFFEILMY